MVKLYWRVRAKGSGGTGSWSDDGVLNRTRLAGPNLLAPANGALLEQPGQPPVLRWDPVVGATKYTVEVDTGANPDWVGSKKETTKTTSFVWREETQQESDTTYSWRVVAEVGDGQLTEVSASRNYTNGALQEINGATIYPPVNLTPSPIEEVVLDWDAVPGAVYYDLRVATDDSYSVSSTVLTATRLRGTRFSPAKTFKTDTLYWQVRPRNAFDAAPDWNDLPDRTFRRTWEGSGDDPRPRLPRRHSGGRRRCLLPVVPGPAGLALSARCQRHRELLRRPRLLLLHRAHDVHARLQRRLVLPGRGRHDVLAGQGAGLAERQHR